MPAAASAFRAVCGCFLAVYVSFMAKRARQSLAMRVAIVVLQRRTDGVMFGFTLVYLFWGGFLLQCGDIETNPGPDPKTTRQTRLTSTSAGMRTSMEKPGNPQGGASNQPPAEHTIAEVINILHTMKKDMDTQFEELKQEVHELRDGYIAMQEEIRGLREEVTGLRQQNEDLKRQNNDMVQKMNDLERKTDDLEGRSKRNNVIFYGLPRRENETNADCEARIQDLITDKLELPKDVDFDRVHRLNAKPDSPIIARCVFYKQKVSLLKAKNKLKGTNIFVGEDFSTQVRELRRKLTPRADGKRTTIIFNYLLVDGKTFTVNSKDKLVEYR